MVSNNKKLFLALLLVALALLAFGCTQNLPDQNIPQEKASFSLSILGDTNTIILHKVLQVDKNTNAFDAMKLALDNNLEYDTYAFGPFVKSILGITPDPQHFWALYVNGVSAQQGIAGYTLDSNIEITWKLEEIQTYPAS